MQIPRATYRLQLNEHCRLADALALVPYLHDLGISHLYSAPLFKATPHSTHGYDVCDFQQLNPELGTETDLERLADALHARKMGLVIDLVPNHMGIGSPENTWWWDVLANGKSSPFAKHFDIDWERTEPDLRGKVLVPLLGGEYETVLQQGELQVRWEQEKWVLGYHEHRFPLAPQTTAGMPAGAEALKKFNADPGALDTLIQQQHYRLAFHAHGDAQLNYRRFFAVSSLAAVCMEQDETFAAAHSRLRQWLEKGLVDGLRVDHPDGLRNPGEYLRRLRALAPHAWIITEKILEPGEVLPATWPVQGTTGYDFLNQVNGVWVDSAAEKALTDLYTSFTGEPADYPVLLLEKKRAVLNTLLVAELNRLTALLAGIAAQTETMKVVPRALLRESVAEVVVNFPVYRSYVTGSALPEAEDVAVIKAAVHLACEQRKDLPAEVFAFIHTLLLTPKGGPEVREFNARLQQLTGAVMAKGAEDTAFYCFNRFTSLNEVGGNPGKFGVSLGDFHAFLQQQSRAWPHSQLTTSTHDTKRAEDVRARLNVLSEIPGVWAQTVSRWSAINACHREGPREDPLPDRNAEYLFYQTLVGAWPLSEDRAQAYMEKASHEAKQHTGWNQRNPRYEAALRRFISETLRDPEFTTDLERLVTQLSEAAAVNSLGQVLLKLTAPGVPDIYQGCELWDYSLVDPDNRRPVDFALRGNWLKAAASASAEAAWQRRADGLPKLWLIQRTLQLRAQIPDFSTLDYAPVTATGPKAGHVVAFSRGGRIIPVVPRFWHQLNHDWQDTGLELPDGTWHDELSREIFCGRIHLADLLRKFPAALLVRKEQN